MSRKDQILQLLSASPKDAFLRFALAKEWEQDGNDPEEVAALERLAAKIEEALRKASLWVSLSGAAGTASALGPKADKTRAALAEALGLRDPGRSWHTDRGPVLRLHQKLRRTSDTGKAGLAVLQPRLNEFVERQMRGGFDIPVQLIA